MVDLLDPGFYLADAAFRPDWEGADTDVVTQPALRERDRALLPVLSRADLPTGHLLVASSGSSASDTGSVRFVALPRTAFLASAEAVNRHLGVVPTDVWAHALPLFHVGGLGILARAHLSRSPVVPAVDGKWDARTYRDRVAASGATLSALVPSQVHDLVAAGLRAPASIRAIVIGGARLDPATYEAALVLGWPCLPSYGMTESCSQVATARPEQAAGEYPEVLPVLPHAELRAGPDGRLHVRAASLLTCYVFVDLATGRIRLEDPKRAGWFETEDYGQVLASGVAVSGRGRDTVKVLGELVSLAAVESALRCWLVDHPEDAARIGDFAVTSLSHPRLGAELILAVVPAAGEPDGVQMARRVESWLRHVLGPVERPARVVAVEGIPRTALGKVQRDLLAGRLR